MKKLSMLLTGLVFVFAGTLTSCQAPKKSPLPLAWTSPEQFDATFREAFTIFLTVKGQEKQHVGFLYRQAKLNDEINWVEDTKHRRVGFFLPNDHAFRLVPTGNNKEPKFTHEGLGEQSREGAISKLLKLNRGEITLQPLLKRGKINKKKDR